MSKTAVILAGGQGTRLRPFTLVLPKPLVPIGGTPILEIVIRQLKQNGFERIIMAVNHQAELVQAFFGAGERWGVKIEYSKEDKPLGTMGPLRLISSLPDTFLIMNGDILTDLNFNLFLNTHTSRGNLFSIASFLRAERSQYGVIELDSTNYLSRFHEKPLISHWVSMGIYAASRGIINLIPEKGPFGFDTLVLKMLKQKSPPYIQKHEGHWLDIGIPSDCDRAAELYEQNIELFGGARSGLRIAA